ncbi:MAG: SGNH/GDSL hydrolase family protein [Lacisediminihabitans sp.]
MGNVRIRRRALAVGSVMAIAAGALVAGQATTAFAAGNGPALSTATTSQLQVLTIGDSIMRGHGLAEGQAWPLLLASSAGVTVTNSACDGAGVLAVGNPTECTGNFGDIVAAASSLHPDIVIFEGSSNDFGLDDSALLAATVSELAAIRADFPDAEIVGLSTLWGYTEPPAQLTDVNSQVEQAVTAVGGAYIDLGQPMQGHPELMQDDNVHPNAQGQAVLASAIQTALQPSVNSALQKAQLTAQRLAHMHQLLERDLIY